MNTFMNKMNELDNYTLTQNGALAYKSTNSAVYDMFALCGAYRQRSDADCILAFKKALEEDPELAMKCLFYLRDCRGGQGERRFFRVCFGWLINYNPKAAARFLKYIPEYGRWDDLIYFVDTNVKNEVITILINQIDIDLTSQKNGISLLAKWMPSENASSSETKRRARVVREAMGLTSRQYRKILSLLREKINVLERLMSANRWDEIEFDKIPSKAGMVYRNAFARRDIIAAKYKAFAEDKDTKVNADTLYPYEVVNKVTSTPRGGGFFYQYNEFFINDVERQMLNKYWENLPDYFEGKECSLMCVVDTSASMTWSGSQKVKPIDVAISLGLYTAERLNGPFKDNYISFSRNPKLIHTDGIDFVDKVERIYQQNLCENTDLTKTFDMLLSIALQPDVRKEDIPQTIVVISDMQIDSNFSYNYDLSTEMEKVRNKWAKYGLEMPRLVYWNVNASKDTILDKGPKVSCVSGCSPILFKQVITGKNGYDLMLETLMSERYACIK